MLDRRRIVLSLAAFGCSFRATGANAVLELVMVEEPGCPWCARWKAEIGPIYPKTAEGRIAPLRQIDISDIDPDILVIAKRVVFTPTFILARDGAEIGRIEGYPGEELFWWFLSALMRDHDLIPEGEPK